MSGSALQLTRGKRSRGLLLDAAHPLFIKQGYAATSMRQIAESAGLALGGIYNHFPSKEAVFQAILMERHPYQQIMPLLKQMQADTPGNVDRNTARNLVNEIGKHSNFFNLMSVEMVEFKGSHLPELFENVLGGVSPPAHLRVYLSMFVSYHMTQSLLIGTMPPDTQGYSPDAFVDIFLYGILKSELVYEFSSTINHT
ncbi:MAG: helix-turn-helix domain-containing protein [Anaerolineales bacterium]|nr:helix-turn-helix domain-containing protein [Anaerolineales bacterium]